MQGHLKEQDEFFQYILAQLAAQGTMSPEKYGEAGGARSCVASPSAATDHADAQTPSLATLKA